MSKKDEAPNSRKLPLDGKEPGRPKWNQKEHENDYAMLCSIIMDKNAWGSEKKDKEDDKSEIFD